MADLSHSFWRTGQFDDGGVWSAENSSADAPTCDGGRAALGKWGLRLGPVAGVGGYSRVTSSVPAASQWRLRIRCHFAAGWPDWPDGQAFYFLYHYAAQAAILQLRRSGSHLQVLLTANDDAAGWQYAGWHDIDHAAASWATLELRGKHGAGDGAVSLWVNGQPAGSLSGLDNDSQSMAYVRLGFVTGVDAAMGPVYVDDVLFVDASGESAGEASCPLYSGSDPFPPLLEARAAGGVVLHSSDYDRGEWFDSDVDTGGAVEISADYALSGRFGYRVTYPAASGDASNVSRHIGRARRVWGRLRFRIDLSTWSGGNEPFFTVTDDTSPTAKVCFRFSIYNDGGVHYLYYSCGNDIGSESGQTQLIPRSGTYVLEWFWTAATGPEANDGKLQVWLNGQAGAPLSSVDNDTLYTDRAVLGTELAEAASAGWMEIDEVVVDDRPLAGVKARVEVI